MVGLLASWWRASISCGLTTMAGAGLLISPAQAAAGDDASLVETALVTHWSLSLPTHKVSAMTASEFTATAAGKATATGATSPLGTGVAPTAPKAIANTAPAVQQAPSVRAASVEGPTLVDDEPEAREPATYRAERSYRTPRDIKALEVAFQLLNAADAITTVVCLNRDDCHESNPIHGKHPKAIVVVSAKAAVGALHYLAMRSLLPDNPELARALGWISVTVQGTVVGLNISQLF